MPDTIPVSGAQISSESASGEHILVCLSPSPSNAKIIRTSARMAKAFQSSFTALYVKTPAFSSMSSEDQKRLQSNIRLAIQSGARIETVYGDDIAYQISEFARLSGVTRIVIGRTSASRRHPFSGPSLLKKLITLSPDLDIHIIPDQSAETYHRHSGLRPRIAVSFSDILKCVGALILASGLGLLFELWGFTESTIITIYILSVLITAIITSSQIYSLIAAMTSVITYNFLFTEPKYTLLAYDPEYPVTFLIMFFAALITGTLAARLKGHARQSAQTAWRTKILFDTSQQLSKLKDNNQIMEITAGQLVKLLKRNVAVWHITNNTLDTPQLFTGDPDAGTPWQLSDHDNDIARWVLENNKSAGATTEVFPEAQCLYHSIHINENVYAVIGICLHGQPLETFETSILLSILGECALALENVKNAREKEEAAVLAKNEQLRANLLRTISHDLRTPLTSISGNASNLLSNGEYFDEATKKALYSDIYDDSLWLINLVENLLAITRISDGKISLRTTTELMEEIITEALRHTDRRSSEHIITVNIPDSLLLVQVDSRLIVQVFINLIDNAIKYTPAGSHIQIEAIRTKDMVTVSVSDDGPGIAPEDMPKVFDMFYCGANKIADSRRSMGLGLALCKAIITAHDGDIKVNAVKPHGTVFTFTLPAMEVHIHD